LATKRAFAKKKENFKEINQGVKTIDTSAKK